MPLVLLLVLGSALAHAGWNTVLKGRSDRLVLVAVGTLLAAVLMTPPAALTFRPPDWPVPAVVAASAATEFAYFQLLSAAYGRGDLGLIYPIARGSAPVYVAVIAGLLLGERLSPIGYAGIALVVAGAILVNLPAGGTGWAWPAVGLALATGCSIALYSVIDKVGVGLYPPIPYLALVFALTGLAMTASMAARLGAARLAAIARRDWIAIIVIAVGSIVAYLSVLFAMQLAPVSLVAPLRELSIVAATLLGWLFLKEKMTPHRLTGSLVICGGVVALSVSRS
ncbi:MAG TPA: DMT family transporter [Dehalococcoidia bacterium]|nr:DMT family transporter [Dehalococcoidia bacterium]